MSRNITWIRKITDGTISPNRKHISHIFRCIDRENVFVQQQ